MSDEEAFGAVARRLVPEGRLVDFRPLEGGVSATVHALEIEDPSECLRRVVVRQQGTLKSAQADALATEYALVGALRSQGFPVPRALLLDLSGDDLPKPYYVMDFVEGSTVLEEDRWAEGLRQMAEFLARLHERGPEAQSLPRLPELEDPVEGMRDFLPKGPLGERVGALLEGRGPWLPKNPAVVLHGDFWPGNVLWQDGGIAAVLDWEDASVGDPLSDLASARLELVCEYGEAAMEAFTAHYRSLSDLDWTDLPVWEIYASASSLATMADWGLDPEVEAHRRSVTQAFLELAVNALGR